MKKFLVFSFAFIFALTPFFSVNYALAASTYVDTNVSFNQGDTKDGSTIGAARSDPSEALGVEDGNFVSLGYGGEIVLAFANHIGGGYLDISAFERTNSTDYALEEAEVYVSSDNVNWTSLGVANNQFDGGSAEDPRETMFELSSDACIKYVKLVDITDGTPHIESSDGYDLDAVGADYETECQPEEPCEECQSGNDVVINDNSAVVANKVTARSNTGGNVAGGSHGGNGGEGGNINGGDVDESSTGNGGAGGDAGIGGTVISGNANSTASLSNEINTSRTIIDRCACEEGNCCDEGHTMVLNRNRVLSMNEVGAMSNTGRNVAEGSYAGSGGDGGNIGEEERHIMPFDEGNNHHEEDGGRVEESSTGNGGAGGNSSDGGYIQTGSARSNTSAINVINRSITRIAR